MALFKISKGNASDLWTSTNSKAAKEGFAWFTKDDGHLYIDIANAENAILGTSRIPLNAYKTFISNKDYTGVTCSADGDPAAYLYFAKIHRSNYYDVWHIKYRIYLTINGVSDGHSWHEVDWYGSKNTYYAYHTYNAIANTSYRPLYEHILYTSTSTGVDNNNGGLLGIRFYSSYKPATAANARDIHIEIIEADNCSIEFLDNMQIFGDVNVSGHYQQRYAIDGTTQGNTMTGDRNTTSQLYSIDGNGRKAIASADGGIGLHRYTLQMMNANGDWTSIAALTGSTSNNNDNSTNKTATTASLLINSPIIYMSNNSYVAPGASANVNGYTAISLDLRYSTKCASTLIIQQPVYLVGTPDTDGTFKLDVDAWWTQTLPTEVNNKIYIFLGLAYNNYCIYLWPMHPIFEYKYGSIREYNSIGDGAIITTKLADLAVTNAKIANGTITNAKLVSNSINVAGNSLALGSSISKADLRSSLGVNKIYYGVCSTAAATVEKAVTCTDFVLEKGAIIFVTFDNTNSGAVANLKLNVNSTGAKPLKHWYNGGINNLPGAGYLGANQTYIFYYDGTNWVTINNYNTNDNTLVTQDYSTTNSSYPLLFTAEGGITSTSSRGAKKAILNNAIYANPSTGTVYATTFNGALSGNANTASKFNSNRTVALTGDVTGSVSGDGSSGWSVATTIGSGKVTNAMLAGSINRNKLLSNSISIAGTSVMLGDSIDATTLRTNLGLTNAMHFLGVTTTNISTSLTTQAVTIGDNSVTAADGDVVLYGSKEYVWGNSTWNLLGDEGSYKIKQDAITSPTANGTAGAFIDTISQNANGQITATKKTISITKSQISDFPTSMTPSSHSHGNITNGGAIGSTANYAVYTTTSGKLTAGTLAVSSPTADGTASAFIDTISQDSKGQITATKKTISITKSQISDFPTSMTPTSHTHGNITNAGALGTASVAVVTDSNKKITTANLSVSDPTANGSGLSFIATASQNGQGKISITKQTVQTASTEQPGVVQLGVANGAATYEHNHSGVYKPVQTAVTSPTADGTAGAFIDTISQNTNGVISVTKKTISITKSQISDFPTTMTPASHTHGNITNGGAIGSTADYAVYTTTSGKLTAGSLAVTSPTADGTAAAFIDTISQNSKGQITATKKTISITKSQISDFPTSMTPTSHTHGNIANGGTLGAASVAVVTDGNKKITTSDLTVSDPTANGNGLTFISTISQNGQGKITATKKTVQAASTTQAGIIQIGTGATNAAAGNHTHSYLSAISWDSTNKKITKSINSGTAADVVQFTAGNNISLSANSTSLTIGLTVQNNNANLSWGTTSTVATVGSTDINVTMPGIEIVRL